MPTLLRSTLALLLAAALPAIAADGHHWTYSGHAGPEHWGELEPGYAMCAQGRNQSPVDLHAPIRAELSPLAFEYRFSSQEILNNGHTVQVNFAPGSTLAVDGRNFELKQVHFHTPSENRIEGKSFAAEAHFVHADAQGNLAVVAVMFEEGAANPALAVLENAAPRQAGERTPFDAGKALGALLPTSRDYFRYSGSLTTPPCTEGVVWLVLKEPMTVSAAQVASLTEAMHGPNNRPVQQLNARIIAN